ncbi:probable glutathione reductase (NADPH) [Fusarium fujikuroi IMI 58289]|uniref:Glutathione reductase n=1 Tax=Gibberella fujikuroi (strain CBS 195.34 / IMI 58289 / NRRL A-6831) TaxID=1279085 RepID=S0EMU7_GIBF5|nr:probable glutathione reductase (NADPH) [Fusarium fujikuroi IMI 58289]KLP17910.1 putative glutathione reductase (NADPH) [Fusarium fujikuroi]CCT75260.1 probable glutathione reductase (NADPH) [Fusarium fujikuroi IMI 58289]SCO25643.1 probable glutathione reductase (NADPH) [Fusarium fujikuroi]SCO56705.1 probable glutathione reductase (NADPH) [Fusarium fujikuroi]
MATATRHCDFLVIGGGSGGLASARRASGRYGAKVIVVEAKRLGGTCVNVGCIPKKITWNAANLAQGLRDAKSYGFSVEQRAPFDWASFKNKRDAIIKNLNNIHKRNLEKDSVEYMHGRARLVGKNESMIKLHDGTEIKVNAKKILIATGGHPTVPRGIPGAEYGINSDGFFELDHQPKKVALIGAGYIAVEFAGMLNALGTETYLFIRHDKFLRTFDEMIQDEILSEYERVGIHIHKNSKAIGRTPEVEGLGLDIVGIKQNERGQIITDEYQNTNVENIYSLGDVVGKIELTPVAIAAGRKLGDRLFGGERFHNSKLDYNLIPSVVFAHPEVGTIGLTQEKAEKKYGRDNIKIYKTSFTATYYTIMEDRGPSRYKLICQGKDERVVGLHILGLGSGEILQGFGVAIKMGATKKDFDSCVAIHPTSAEELVTLN